MKIAGALLVAFAGLAACRSNPTPAAPDALSILAGRWDEPAADSCQSPHVISFDDARTTMLIEYADVGWVTESDSRKVFRYRILDAGPSAIRMQLENEPRLAADGTPVVWRFVVVDADTYCWGRDDWPQDGCTPPRRRCPSP